jgi:hypothetical protein
MTVRRVVEHRLIEFDWSFLGLGPTARIRRSTEAVPGGTATIVEDRQPDLNAPEVDELIEGCRTSSIGCRDICAAAGPVATALRDQMDGSVTVPCGADLFAPEAIDRWLPVASDDFGPRWFVVVACRPHGAPAAPASLRPG